MKKVFGLFSISLFLCPLLPVMAEQLPDRKLIAVTSGENPAASTPTKRSEVDSKGSSEEREIGVIFENKNQPQVGDSPNTIFLIGTNFVGQCPALDAPEGDARFFSKTKMPADNLRLIIKNVTFGFAGSEKPNTNREYYIGDTSEGFNVRFGDSHNGRYLAVKPGNNQFEYVIKDRDTIVDSGDFSIVFDKKINTVQRDMQQFVTGVECANEKCTSLVPKMSYQCQGIR
jgi:hypothetical protein